MKKLLVLAALSMAAAPAMASKARLTALGNSEQLKDAQTIFTRPSDLTGLGNWATAELGATSALDTAATAVSPNAEGGFARSYGEGYLGFYLGHRNAGITQARDAADDGATAALLLEENPVEVYYAAKAGDLTWGASVWYSNSEKKAAAGNVAAKSKQSSMGVRGSVETGAIDAYVHIGLVDTAKDDTNTHEYKGGMPMTLGAGYTMGDAYVFAKVSTVAAKATVGGTDSKYEGSDYKVGYISSTKSEGSNFFWGVAFAGANRGKELGTSASTTLPFWFGVEQEANSWLTLRGSVTQNVILGGYKNGGSESNTTDNNTTAAAGVGIKWNKLVLDGSIATANGTAANQGDVVGDNFLSNVALTYMF